MLKNIRAFSIVIVLLVSYLANAQQGVLTSYNIFNLKSVSETSISPDGKMIAYTVINPRPFSDDPGADYKYLHVYNLETKSSKELVGDKTSSSSIGWMPDSKQILFRAKLNDEKTYQVYGIDINGGTPKKLTDHEKSINNFKINYDGSMLAYTGTESAPPKKEALKTEGFDAEIYEEEYSDINLYIKDLKKEETKKITSNVSVFELVWSPDGNHIAAAIAERNLVDDSYMFKKLYLVDPNNGLKTKLVNNPAKLGEFEFSPDGKHLAFISGVDINDPVDGSLFISEVPSSQSFEELKNYTLGFEGSVIKIEWKDNSTLIYAAEEGVDVTLSEQKINGEKRSIILEPGKVVFTNFDYKNGKISFAGDTPQHPSEVYLFDYALKELNKLTELNPWLNDVRLAKQEKITYEARDGLKIEGVLIYPLGFDEGEKYPLVIYVHGGPESAEQNGWVTSYNKWGQIAAAQGFFVFMPNYRASSGRGVEFSKMDFGDLGAAEFDDVIDGVNYLAEKGYVDKNRVGIGGGSYGGYFAAWGATKHTEHFAASVVFVGISNQLSKRGTTDIPFESYYSHWGFWVHENPELVYDRSPVKYAHQSKTPTLILHGKDDPRVHPSQALELYRNLKLHGEAPVRLVLYPGQGHGNTKNTSKLDYSLRTMQWFDYYLNSKNPKDKMPDKYLEIEVKENI